MDKDLSDKQKLLVALISNLSNEKGYAFPSNKYLADCLSCSEVTIRQNISTLEEKGYIVRVLKLNSKNELEYRSLTVVERNYPPMKINHPPLIEINQTPDENQSPPPDENQSHNNKLINNKEYINSAFDKFWKLYPVKKDKKKAHKKWCSLPKSEIEKIFLTFEEFLDDKPFLNYNYPFATTYLNGERWKDYEVIQNEVAENSIKEDTLKSRLDGLRTY